MIEIDRISVAYDGATVLHNLSLEVAQGEFFTLLGPSGCGKTTLLRALSGFAPLASGRIRIDGRDVGGLPPEARGVGVVFQNYALFPHLSVADNVAFGPRVAGRPRREIADAVAAALARVGVAAQAARKPAELSGGQQQRVAIARALILGSRVLLLDEPLSNLDAALRETMREEILALQRALDVTAVYVTHDQQEALAISDRIAVMAGGRLRQVATPRALYAAPADAFVCGFVGESSRLTPALLADAGAADWLAPDTVGYLRPEAAIPGAHHGEGRAVLSATLRRAVFRGPMTRLILQAGAQTLLCDAPGGVAPPPPGAAMAVTVPRAALMVFPAGAAA